MLREAELGYVRQPDRRHRRPGRWTGIEWWRAVQRSGGRRRRAGEPYGSRIRATGEGGTGDTDRARTNGSTRKTQRPDHDQTTPAARTTDHLDQRPAQGVPRPTGGASTRGPAGVSIEVARR